MSPGSMPTLLAALPARIPDTQMPPISSSSSYHAKPLIPRDSTSVPSANVSTTSRANSAGMAKYCDVLVGSEEA